MIVIAAFYKFTHIADCTQLKSALELCFSHHQIKGTVILATEGVNGTVSGSREAIDGLNNFFRRDSRFSGMEYKESFALDCPFMRTKIRIKDEIVTLKHPLVNPEQTVGVYVNAQEWNHLLNDPEVTIIDVRNDFEVCMGSFTNAINPKTTSFSDFPDFVKNHLSPTIHKKIAMSCTGGIRCEKASSLMKSMGFPQVFHLKGGVLQYLQDIPKEESEWRGECFVFDQRIALDHDLKPTTRTHPSHHDSAFFPHDERP